MNHLLFREPLEGYNKYNSYGHLIILFIGSFHRTEVIIIAAMESRSIWVVCHGEAKADTLKFFQNHLSIREGHMFSLKNEYSVNIVGD